MSFRILHDEEYADNERRTAMYQEQLHSPEGARHLEYLHERGLEDATIERFRLGACLKPEPIDSPGQGRVVIPHMNQRGVVTLRFRSLPENISGPKYWQASGSAIGIYNITEFSIPRMQIAVCEGEFDTMILNQIGVPAVGFPGAQTWKDHHRYLFDGYAKVIICGDGDEAGEAFADKVAANVPGPYSLPMPDGHDINSSFLEAGRDALLEYLGMKETTKA